MKNIVKKMARWSPGLWLAIYQFFIAKKKRAECVVDRNTQIVIEGFPRSANTYSVVAFRLAQEGSVNIAHHIHNEAQVLVGVKLCLPIMVLIRQPDGAVKSYIIRHPEVGVDNAYKRYFDFYSAIRTVSDDVLLIEFQDAISNLGFLVGKLNDKYGTTFSTRRIKKSDVFKEIDRINNEQDEGKLSHVARPVHDRPSDSNWSSSSKYRNRCLSIYSELSDKARKSVL